MMRRRNLLDGVLLLLGGELGKAVVYLDSPHAVDFDACSHGWLSLVNDGPFDAAGGRVGLRCGWA
jgi:hypothetical protein